MSIQVLKVFAVEDGPANSTGKPRWHQGDELQLRVSNGMVWVCGAALMLEGAWQGGGLLYTYAAEDLVEVDGKKINWKGGKQ